MGEMRKGIANETYTVLAFDSDLSITKDELPDIEIDQFEGEELEVWKEREDGLLFVYCNRLDIGYWVIPSLIRI